MTKQTAPKTLPMNLRVLIGLAGLPSLVLGAMLLVMVLNGQSQEIGGFELIYSLVGFFAMYMAFTGKRLF